MIIIYLVKKFPLKHHTLALLSRTLSTCLFKIELCRLKFWQSTSELRRWVSGRSLALPISWPWDVNWSSLNCFVAVRRWCCGLDCNSASSDSLAWCSQFCFLFWFDRDALHSRDICLILPELKHAWQSLGWWFVQLQGLHDCCFALFLLCCWFSVLPLLMHRLFCWSLLLL